MRAIFSRRTAWRFRGGALLLSAAVCVAPARADSTRFRGMTPYAEARETFRKMGYQPYFMPGADICDANDPRCYPELESCAKSRTWACTYTWRRGRAVIEVETRYEHPVVAFSTCIVNCNALQRARKGDRAAAPGRTPTASAD